MISAININKSSTYHNSNEMSDSYISTWCYEHSKPSFLSLMKKYEFQNVRWKPKAQFRFVPQLRINHLYSYSSSFNSLHFSSFILPVICKLNGPLIPAYCIQVNHYPHIYIYIYIGNSLLQTNSVYLIN